MKDELGDQFKAVERSYREVLPTRAFHILRIDGKAFHTWTRGLKKPFDPALLTSMDLTAISLAEAISGTLCVYTQSDEISVITTDLIGENTEAWFGGQIQKMVSVSASIATVAFNTAKAAFWPGKPEAMFDARAFALHSVEDVANYLRWRQDDARRNAVSMLAHHYIGKNAVHGMGTAARVQMLRDMGHDPDQEDRGFLNGRIITDELQPRTVNFTHKKTGVTEEITVDRRIWVANPSERIRNWFYDTYSDQFEGASA